MTDVLHSRRGARARRARLARRAPRRGGRAARRRRLADRRRGDLALQPHRRARPRALPAVRRPTSSGEPGDERGARRRSVGRGGRRARGHGRRARRPGRAPRARSRARGQGRARLRHRHVRRRRGRARCSAPCSDASADAFTVLHDAFLAGGAFVHVPAGVVVEDPILVLHWCEGDGRGVVPAHARRRWARAREVTVLDRFGSPETDHLVDAVAELLVGDNAHLRYLSVQEHGSRTWHLGLQRAHVGRDATLRSRRRSRSAATTRACAASRCSTGQGAESDLLAVYFGDGDQMLDFRTLQDHDAPRHAQRPAVQGRGRGHRPLGVLRARSASARRRRRRTRPRRTATSCSPRAPTRESIPNLEIEANDVQCSHASHRRPDRRRPALLPRDAAASRPRRPSGSSCSGSSTTCSSACRCASLVAPSAPLASSRSSSTATRSRGR